MASLLKSPTSAINFDTGNGNWDNPTNALTSNNTYAREDIAKNGQTDDLYVYGYDFDIDLNATIDGILVSVERYSENASNISDNAIYLTDTNSSTKGNNLATTTGWATSKETVTYGGASDLWGSTWTPSDINNSNFGVKLSAVNSNSTAARNAYVDYISITVYYTEGVTPQVQQSTFLNFSAF